jgi:hypothetical protein
MLRSPAVEALDLLRYSYHLTISGRKMTVSAIGKSGTNRTFFAKNKPNPPIPSIKRPDPG